MADGTTRALQAALAVDWAEFEDWYSDSAVNALAVRSADKAEQAQAMTRTHVDAYMRQVYDMTGVPFPDESFGGLAVYPRLGVTPEQVWERPVRLYRRMAAQGVEDPRPMVLQRVGLTAETEVALAQRDRGSRILAASTEVIGYRRVVHPELSRTGVCGLCLAAADRVYDKKLLLPIHARCKCTVAPVTPDYDPGQGGLLSDDLQRLYDEAGSSSQSDLSNVRVHQYVSSELGPVLTRSGEEVEAVKRRVAQQETTRIKIRRESAGLSTPQTPGQVRRAVEDQVSDLTARLQQARAAKDSVAERAIRGKMTRTYAALQRLGNSD